MSTETTTAVADQDVKREVREKYGRVAKAVSEGTSTDSAECCSSACCGSTTDSYDPITSNLYDDGEKAGVPAEALLASLGWVIRRLWPSSIPGKRCSTSAPAAESTCCCPPSASGRQARCTDST